MGDSIRCRAVCQWARYSANNPRFRVRWESLHHAGVRRAGYDLLMAMTFDATLKEMGLESPAGFLSTFDKPPVLQVSLLNVDLSTVTRSADLVIGLGNPLSEIVQIEFHSSATAWKHTDVMAYHALLHAHHHVSVHSLVILLRQAAAHAYMNGVICYSPRPGRVPFSGGRVSHHRAATRWAYKP